MGFIILFLATLVSTALAQTVTLCDQYAYYQTNGYEFNNNLWGKGSASSGSQCTYVDGYTGNGVKWRSDWQWAGGDNNVKSYVYSGRQITKKLVELNMRASELEVRFRDAIRELKLTAPLPPKD